MKFLKIGVVLDQYPVISETFIDTFLTHLSDYNVIIYASQNSKNYPIKYNIIPYINNPPNYNNCFNYFKVLIKIPFFTVRIFRLYKKGIRFKQLIADAGILTTKSLDILHFPFATNAIGRELYASCLGAKMTLSYRGSDLNVYPIYHQFTYYKILSYVDRVHCNSMELEAKLSLHGRNDNLPVQVIYPALRNTFVNSRHNSLNMYGVGTFENPLVISTIGRLHWVKDYPFALRIMNILKQRGIVFKYFILGEGREREQLMFLINELRLQEYVFLCGSVNSDQINNHLSDTHLYLQTSLSEGFSNSCIEAQSFGIPCVVPDISGMSECIEDGKTGIIVRSRNENHFVESILYLIKNYNSIDPHYISSRVKNKFSVEFQRIQWNQFFNSLF